MLRTSIIKKENVIETRYGRKKEEKNKLKVFSKRKSESKLAVDFR